MMRAVRPCPTHYLPGVLPGGDDPLSSLQGTHLANLSHMGAVPLHLALLATDILACASGAACTGQGVASLLT